MFDNLLVQPGKDVSEQDFRINILNALLKTPHKNYEPFIPLFAHVAKTDPLFFAHLAAWYSDSGTVRDLNQLFAAFLTVSQFSSEHREAGLELLKRMPPHQVESVLRILKGREKDGKFLPGISTGVPRSFRTAVKDYLREREANPEMFQGAVLFNRKSLRSLYASLRIKPGETAQQVLFDNKPLEGTRLAAIKSLANSKDATEQARLIVEHKIPYRVAVTMIQEMTAPVIAALVSVMSPQELINNMNSLEKRGATKTPEIRKLIEDKLEKAKTDKRVSALKTRTAAKASNLDAGLSEKLAAVGDVRIKATGKIKKSTALLIDKSGSLSVAIEVGKALASVIAPVCTGNLVVYAFDTMVYPIEPRGKEMSDWEAAFKGITANGGTSCGSPIERLLKQKIAVEQIIMVTDEEENQAPYMVASLEKYNKELGTPNIVFLRVGNKSQQLEKLLQKAGHQVDAIDFTGDYYSLPSLIPMLAGGSIADLLGDIMDYPLPVREQKEAVLV